MNVLLALLSAMLQSASGEADDPCLAARERAADASAAQPSDRESAAAYRAVGDEQRESGDVPAARVAYRQALLLDPDDATSRAALQALCRSGALSEPHDAGSRHPEAGRFEEGMRRMQGGDRAGAIVAFEAVRASGPDPPAALLEAICELELGHEEQAKQLLGEARVSPATADSATFFLALIALDRGDGNLASALFSKVAAGGGPIAENAADFLRLSRKEGLVVVSGLTELGFDSNVQLLPDGTPNRGGTADGYWTGAAGAFLRPWGTPGPYARITGQYRQQAQVTTYDLGDVGGAIGMRLGRPRRLLVGEYSYDFLWLGGTSYLGAHRLLGTARWAPGPLAVSLTYAARFESFLTSATAGYTGVRQDADAEADWLQGPAIIGAGYHVGRDSTRDVALGYFEHGPFGLLRFGTGRPARLLVEARFTLRTYAAVDPDLAVDRSDRYVDGGLTGELDVSDRWTVRVAATARRALSNVPDFQYSKLTATVGLVYAMGVL